MAYTLAKVGPSFCNSFRHFICDSAADLEEMKKQAKDVPMGSTCYIIEDGSFYILNGKREWKKGTAQVVTQILGG